MAREIEKHVEEAIVTTADMLRAEGRSKGPRATLLRQLGNCFGALPEDAVNRVNAAVPADLEERLDRVITAPTLAALLGEG